MTLLDPRQEPCGSAKNDESALVLPRGQMPVLKERLTTGREASALPPSNKSKCCGSSPPGQVDLSTVLGSWSLSMVDGALVISLASLVDRPPRWNWAGFCLWCEERWCTSQQCIDAWCRSTWEVCDLCRGSGFVDPWNGCICGSGLVEV